MLKEQLTSKVAGIILEHVRSKKGRLTELSDWCRINRKEFNVRGVSKMKFHRVLRILYALHLKCDYFERKRLWNEMSETIQEYADEFDFILLDE